MSLWAAAAMVATVLGALLWPSPWADPRRPFWLEQVGSRRGHGPVPASAHEVATGALLLSIALRSGLPVAVALERVVDQLSAELRADLLPVLSAYERGCEPAEAWQDVPDLWAPVAAALVVAQRAGVAPSALLLTASDAVLRRESALRESAIARVGVRLVLPLGAVLLPAFMCTTVVPLVIVMTTGFIGP